MGCLFGDAAYTISIEICSRVGCLRSLLFDLNMVLDTCASQLPFRRFWGGVGMGRRLTMGIFSLFFFLVARVCFVGCGLWTTQHWVGAYVTWVGGYAFWILVRTHTTHHGIDRYFLINFLSGVNIYLEANIVANQSHIL